jgi:peptidoglycan/LPS O-acetylase OafA/YrhL
MVGHCQAFYFFEYKTIAPSTNDILVKAIYFVTGFGQQAVMVFFVLSRLFISSSVLRNLERGTWRWGDYVIDRGVRLYLVLIPGLLLGAFWGFLGIHFFNDSGIYSAPLPPFGDSVPAQQLNMSTFLGNLFFLQTRFTIVLGSNGLLWSLFNEFGTTFCFPVLTAVVLSVKRRSISLVVLCWRRYLCRLCPLSGHFLDLWCGSPEEASRSRPDISDLARPVFGKGGLHTVCAAAFAGYVWLLPEPTPNRSRLISRWA